MIYYKVVSKNKAKDGGNFDYKKYLPKKKNDGTWKKGKWTPRLKNVVECEKGYHITKYWNMWLSNDCEIYEVEFKGLQKNLNQVGVSDKEVCETIRLIKRIIPSFDEKRNTGNRNTGNRNTGDSNTGNCNTGNCNTGNCNTGNCNTGYSNTGDRNTGYSNTGDCNTGDCNTGDCNTGDWNTGDCNTGAWNTGDRNTGYFNTITPQTVLIFNKKCLKEIWDNCKKPDFLDFEIGKDYKKAFKESFKKTSKEDVKLLLKLPNFEYEIFEEISGITKRMIQTKIR